MKIFALSILFALASFTAAFAENSAIHVSDVHARPTPPTAPTGVIYLTLMNRGTVDDRLTGLSTPVADKAEMHRSTMENGIMKMEPVTELRLKAGETAEFKAGGLHIMLTGLKQPLKPGDSFPLTLSFAKAGPVTTTVSVEQRGGKPASATPGMNMHDMKM